MKLITVFSSTQLMDVYFAKSILDNAGIESNIVNENTVGVVPHYSLVIGGVRLVVREGDFAEAKELLDDFIHKTKKPPREKIRPPRDPGRCPKCGGENITISKIPLKLPSLIATLWFMIPIPLRKKYYQCTDCRAYW